MSTNILTAPYFRSTAAETDAGDSFVDSIFICMVLIALPIKNPPTWWRQFSLRCSG